MKSSQTNTFTGGMQKDLHPMTTPNNVLTDALNATITTMNGNESVLQNDMGNARVESAYLPEGYIPIGMKEYGGVIYIASYNPVTEKGQVGSFPSPERNIESIQGAGCSLDFNSLLASKNWSTNYSEIQNYSIKLELENGRIFHPGDMFSLIADLNKIPFTVTNQLRNEGAGDISLGLYVLDSSNNLVNITDNLNFYYPDEIDNYKKGDIIEDINNRYLGTFIKPAFSSLESQVDGERSYTDYNTFNSKIAGKVYLIATLNSINSIDVDISGETTKQNDVNTATLQLNIDYKYNCPKDNIINPIVNIYKIDKDGKKIGIIPKVTNFENINKCTIQIDFDPNNDNSLFVEVIPQHIINNLLDGTDIIVNSMQSLKSTLEIDLNKLNSGEFKINTWRYYNNIVNGESRTNLVWGLEAYPKKSQKVKNIKFKFINLLTGDITTLDVSGKKNYFGTFNESLDLVNKTLYLTQLYKVLEKDNGEKEEEFIGERFILTTPLLNNCFFAESSDYLQDYVNIIDGNNVFTKYHTVTMDGEGSSTLLKQLLPITTEIPLQIIQSSQAAPVQQSRHTEQYSSYLVNYIPKIQNQKNYPFELDKQKISIKLAVEDITAENNGEAIKYNIYNNSSTDIDENNNYMKYEVKDVRNTGLSKCIDFTNHLVSKFSGEYKLKSNIVVNTIFKSPKVDDLFGFGFNNSPWWLASRTWVVDESGSDETGLGHILTYNKISNTEYSGSVVYKFYENRDNGTNRWNIEMDKDGGAVVYNKVVDYLSKSKGKPTVALWSSFGDAKVEETDKSWNGTGIANIDTKIRTFGFEYAWWLGTDGQYYLLSNAVIPNVNTYVESDQFSTMAKKSFTLQDKITNAFSKVYIGNTNTSGETKSLYILNPTSNRDITYSIKSTAKIKVIPTIANLGIGQEYFMYNNKNYWNTIKSNYENQNNITSIDTNKQLQFFNFAFKTNNYKDLYLEDLEFTLESKGYEDELNAIQKVNAKSEVSTILETNNNGLFLYDVNNRELDINKVYTLDSENKIRSIDTVPDMKHIYNTFTLGIDGSGNKSLLVRPQITAKVGHTYYNWDEANGHSYLHFYFSDMNSFALPLSCLPNTQSINARRITN